MAFDEFWPASVLARFRRSEEIDPAKERRRARWDPLGRPRRLDAPRRWL